MLSTYVALPVDEAVASAFDFDELPVDVVHV
jgi:hypothetical protein